MKKRSGRLIASLFCLLVWRKDSVSAATGDADACGVRCSHELGVLFFVTFVTCSEKYENR